MRVQVPRIMPPDPPTGWVQEGCYLHSTANCSKRLSAEHYISKSILSGAGKAVSVKGAPWLAQDEVKKIGVSAFSAKILCERHNNGLSPLDKFAGKFFQKLVAILKNLEQRSLSRKHSLVMFSGEMLELWLLKVAGGLYYSGVGASKGKRLVDDYSFNDEIFIDAFFNRKWHNHCGLYFRGRVGENFFTNSDVSFSPLTIDASKRFAGATIRLSGFDFRVVFDPTDANPAELASDGWALRPTELVFLAEYRSHRMALTWPKGVPERSLQMYQIPQAQRRKLAT